MDLVAAETARKEAEQAEKERNKKKNVPAAPMNHD